MERKKKIFIGTTNKGKQEEIRKFALKYTTSIELIFPQEPIKAIENGTTFEENAFIKVSEYLKETGNSSYIYVADDSGIKIPILGNEPGVYTHDWAGYEMQDKEIISFCLDKMKGYHGNDRKAVFETTLAVIKPGQKVTYYYGQMWGHLLEKPIDNNILEGFPFRSIFWVDELDCPIYEIHNEAFTDRKGFLTHRELAFKALFDDLSRN